MLSADKIASKRLRDLAEQLKLTEGAIEQTKRGDQTIAKIRHRSTLEKRAEMIRDWISEFEGE